MSKAARKQQQEWGCVQAREVPTAEADRICSSIGIYPGHLDLPLLLIEHSAAATAAAVAPPSGETDNAHSFLVNQTRYKIN